MRFSRSSCARIFKQAQKRARNRNCRQGEEYLPLAVQEVWPQIHDTRMTHAEPPTAGTARSVPAPRCGLYVWFLANLLPLGLRPLRTTQGRKFLAATERPFPCTAQRIHGPMLRSSHLGR